MLKIILPLFLSIGLLQAEVINAIAAVVNNEPVTLYEIDQTAAQEGVSRAQALQMLIDLRLQEARIKELGLSVSDREVESRIEQIAQRNNLDSATLRGVLRSRGVDWAEYRDQIRQAVLNEKLASRVMADEMVPLSDEQIERYYQQNSESFARPTEVSVVQYAAREEAPLRQVQQNPLLQLPQVSMQTQSLTLSDLNPRLASILAQTPRGEFTPIFPVGETFVTLLVRSAQGVQPRTLDQVRAEIVDILQAKEQERAIESYFARERARAEITILRQP